MTIRNQQKRSVRLARPKGYKESGHAMQEFGPGKEDIVLCSQCNAAYYYKSWHHNLAEYEHIHEKKKIRFMLCPACSMWKNHQWEGEIHIAGIPKEMYKQITNTIFSIADEAYRRDPMHRIFDIKKKGNDMILYTSENQLAHRIAKKLVSSRKGHFSKIKIHHGKGEDAVLITMEWI